MSESELRDALSWFEKRLRLVERRQDRISDRLEYLQYLPVLDLSGDITYLGNMMEKWDGRYDDDITL